MDHDVYDLAACAACAACDLTARMQSDLRAARDALAAAESFVIRAIERPWGRAADARQLLSAVQANRCRVEAIERMLAGVPACHGDCDAA